MAIDIVATRKNILVWTRSEATYTAAVWRDNADAMSDVDWRLALLCRDLQIAFDNLSTYAESVRRTEAVS